MKNIFTIVSCFLFTNQKATKSENHEITMSDDSLGRITRD